MAERSKVHSSLSARQVRPMNFTAEDVRDFGSLALIGIHLSAEDMAKAAAFHGMDAAPDLQPLVGTASIPTPIQFLQTWLPGFVNVLTAARKADELMGINTVGSWEDEELIQGVMERTGLAQPYADHAGPPLSSWNLGWERRSVVRFEQGLEVGMLEERRAAKVKVNTSATKRAAAADALEIQRNRIAFYGYNGGAGRTFGYLNDPGLPAYVTVANGAGGQPGWATKTFQEIIADIRAAAAALRQGSRDKIDPRKDRLTLALPTVSDAYLSVTTDFGQSVEAWIKATYPNWRIETAPELEGANGGVNVFYLYAERINDGMSDDSGAVFSQNVPTKFMTIGVEKRLKTYVEDYTNATAGVMVTRPWAIVRRSGI